MVGGVAGVLLIEDAKTEVSHRRLGDYRSRFFMSGGWFLNLLIMLWPMMLRLLRFRLLLWCPVVEDGCSLFSLRRRLGSHEGYIVKEDGPIINLGSFDWFSG